MPCANELTTRFTDEFCEEVFMSVLLAHDGRTDRLRYLFLVLHILHLIHNQFYKQMVLTLYVMSCRPGGGGGWVHG